MGHRPPLDKVDELKEATRLANEVLKDLKAERKHVEELIAAIRPDTVKIIEESVSSALDGMSVSMKEGIDKSVKRIIARFDHLENLLLGGKTMDRPALEEEVEAFVKKREEAYAPFKPPPLL